MKLLTPPHGNPKTNKSLKVNVFEAILHLAPADLSGREVCHARTPGCTAACLHYAGVPFHMQRKNKARIARTQFFFSDREGFMNQLCKEIAAHARKADRLGLTPAVRLNGTSDLVWERKRFNLRPDVLPDRSRRNGTNIFAVFPEVSFLDYTKIPRRVPPHNYHLTFSLSENNLGTALDWLANGGNVAVVFDGPLPDEWHGYPVIDGDEHDYRPSDPHPCIVGLKAKGLKAKKDTSGFVQSSTPQLKKAA